MVGVAAAASPPNDECSAPSPISGEGEWNLDDLLTATQSTSPPPIPGSSRDVWFCWTPTWTGTAKLDLGLALLYAQVYNGCGCPAPGSGPILTLGLGQPAGEFQVECNQRYLIRIAAELYPFPQTNSVREFELSKVSGTDCPLPTGQVCNDCCGGKPTFNDPLYSTNFTGQVAVVTNSFVGRFGTGGQIVTIFNLAGAPAPVPGANWDPVTGPPSTSFRYSRPDWDQGHLGSVFPVTLDAQGNIYTAYCAATNAPTGSSIAGSTSGTIFRIPIGTGVPAVFCNIPDNLAPPVGGTGAQINCGEANPRPPGIGDVCADCANSNQFFASSFADGRIYRIDSAGVPLQAFDHATNAVQPPTREPGNLYDRYVPRGERVWAVEVHKGRLYYSVWGQEIGCTQSVIAPASQPNTVWSVALDAVGAFVPNSRRMELQVPRFPLISSSPDFHESAPVSDISFSDDCRMMLAERNIAENGVTVGAHAARGLEYAWNGSAWIPTFPRNGYHHPIGGVPVGLPNTNACGGTDYDFATGALPAGRAWFTGDTLLTSPLVYGITAIDRATPAYATAVHIDYDGFYAGIDKAKLCDIEIPCLKGCGEVNDERILCNPPVPGAFTYTFTITNNSGVPVQYILLPGAPFSQHIITLPALLPPGQTSGPISVNLNNLPPGPFCFDIILADETVNECCRIRHCINLPECDCLQWPILRAECIPGQPGTFKLTFNIQNLSWYAVNELFIFPPIGSGIVINPDYFSFPPLAPFATSGLMMTNITGAIPGSQLCLRMSIHHSGEECCSEVVCFTVPAPCPDLQMPDPCTAGAACYADCDGSGVLNINDFICFQTHFAAAAPCTNCDGSTVLPILNVNDFQCFLSKFAAGCP